MNEFDMKAAVLAAQQDPENFKLALTMGELECLGYTVEAVGHLRGLEGRFRWTNTHTLESQHFAAASNSEAEAWARAAEAWLDKHASKGVPSATPTRNRTPAQLESHYSHGGANGGGQHPEFTRADWRHAVGDGETVTGYWAWLASEIRQGKERRSAKKAQPQRLPGWLGAHH